MARRPPPHLWPRTWRRQARRALTGLGLWLAGACGGGAQEVVSARYVDPVTRYDHGVLGDAVEYGALRIDVAGQGAVTFRLPQSHVFEDLFPRLVDLDLDGRNDAVMVVETDMGLGAALALYGPTGKIAETPHIGRTHRWLAPLGAADLDGDGRVELAYVDRPHLAKTLRIWRYANGMLMPVAERSGLTVHRIGEDVISGGIRDCGAGPEIITADADWRRIMASRLTGITITPRDLGPITGPGSIRSALSCQ